MLEIVIVLNKHNSAAWTADQGYRTKKILPDSIFTSQPIIDDIAARVSIGQQRTRCERGKWQHERQGEVWDSCMSYAKVRDLRQLYPGLTKAFVLKYLKQAEFMSNEIQRVSIELSKKSTQTSPSSFYVATWLTDVKDARSLFEKKDYAGAFHKANDILLTLRLHLDTLKTSAGEHTKSIVSDKQIIALEKKVNTQLAQLSVSYKKRVSDTAFILRLAEYSNKISQLDASFNKKLPHWTNRTNDSKAVVLNSILDTLSVVNHGSKAVLQSGT